MSRLGVGGGAYTQNAATGPNAKWIQWLQEEAEALEEKGHQSYNAFHRAAASLRQCPMKIQTTQEALNIKGIGKHIAAFLEKKMKKERNGGEDSNIGTGGGDNMLIDGDAPERKTKKKRFVPDDGLTAKQRREIQGAKYAAGSSDEEEEDSSQKKPSSEKTKNGSSNTKEKKPRAYTPTEKSATWAIMIALFILGKDDRDGLDVCRSQSEIIKEGQPWTSTSFTEGNKKSGEKGKYFTGFNGMKTLTEKELVIKEGRRGEPKGWRLSSKGYLLARKLIKNLEKKIIGDGRKLENGLRVPVLGPLAKKKAAPKKKQSAGVLATFSENEEDADSSEEKSVRGRPNSRGRNVSPPAVSGFRAEILRKQGKFVPESPPAPSQPPPKDVLQPQRSQPIAPPTSSPPSSPNHARPPAPSKASAASVLSSSPARAPPPNRQHNVAGRSVLLAQVEAKMKADAEKKNAAQTSVAQPAVRAVIDDDDDIVVSSARIERQPSSSQLPSAGPSTNSHTNVNEADSMPFYFWYLDEGNNRVINKSDADLFMDSDMMSIYKVEFEASRLEHPFRKKAVLLQSGHEGFGLIEPVRAGTCIGWLKGQLSFQRCKPWDQDVPAPKAPNSSKDVGRMNMFSQQTRVSVTSTASNQDSGGKPKFDRKKAVNDLMGSKLPETKKDEDAIYQPPVNVTFGRPASPSMPITLSDDENDLEVGMDLGVEVSSQKGYDSKAENHRSKDANPKKRAWEELPLSSSNAGFSRGSASMGSIDKPSAMRMDPPNLMTLASSRSINSGALDFSGVRPRALDPKDYVVKLILDTREGGDTGDTANGLRKRGVCVEMRPLEVGDVIWIAQRISQQRDNYDEIVLNYVLERKRLDDLIQSVTGGRYSEQKGRMTRSGITNKIYLIEEFGLRGRMESSWEQAIWTIKSQSQVSDGFHIEWTRSLSDTIECLALRTEVIMEEFMAQESFYVIPEEHVDRSTYLPLLCSLYSSVSPFERPLHTTFANFTALNIKSYAPLSMAWAKMLLRVNGLSDQKCVPIVEKYETPQAFWCAIKGQLEELENDNEEKEGRGKKRRKLNKGESFVMDNVKVEADSGQVKGALSKRIWEIWTQTKYDSDAARMDSDSD
ncbi:hypothetical protein BT69DRAFT_1279033 [Atractiella rhizophila]|nr:hypothetical protein BT69DRAFT_1279033 [Atractiella rhizophila]